MRISATILITVFLFFFGVLEGQQFLNLDFERKSAEGANRAWGWNKHPWGPTTFVMDSLVVMNGNFSIRSTCGKGEKDCVKAGYAFGIEAYEIKEKELFFSAWFRSDKPGIRAGVSIEYEYTDEKTGKYGKKTISGTLQDEALDWTRITVETVLPATATNVQLIVHRKGKGTAWFDQCSLEIDGREKRSVLVADEFTNKQIKWLQQQVSPFASPLPVANFDTTAASKLDFLKKAFEGSTIVALGESTHGTSEFFSLKHKILQYAVEELGFRVFAIEDHLVSCQKVNEYVKGSGISRKEAMAGMFSVWMKQEVYDLVEWIRTYNETHPNDMISFIGFDMQNAVLPIDHLKKFLLARDPEFYDEHQELLAELKQQGQQAFTLTDSLKADLLQKAERFSEAVKFRSDRWARDFHDADDLRWSKYASRYAILIKQFFTEAYHGGFALKRDQAMFDNLTWYLEYIYPRQKAIIWAHDVHISRADHSNERHNLHLSLSMGSFLSKKYGDKYRSFGIFTHRGTFSAYPSYSNLSRIVQDELCTSPKGSLSEALHQVASKTGNRHLFLPLSREVDWLNRPLPIRFANHIADDYGFYMRIRVPYQFDGVFFIDQTTGSTVVK